MQSRLPVRGMAAGAALLARFALAMGLIAWGCRASRLFSGAMRLFGLGAALHAVMRRERDAYKLMWVFLILMFPRLGGAAYALLARGGSARRFDARAREARAAAEPGYALAGDALEAAAGAYPEHANHMRYLQAYAGFPVYDGAGTAYCPTGEDFVDALKCELAHARRYIFLEYFIVAEGAMWDELLAILLRKAGEGVRVRLLFDDLGCLTRMRAGYPERLRARGIECAVFNPVRSVLTPAQNNRDHRKIAIVDGVAAFTGGINLADEYINAVEKHGHWKDTAVCVRGGAAWSMTLMFLQMWALCAGAREDMARFAPELGETVRAGGYAQPFADSPAHAPHVSEQTYLHIIHSARRYLYICTPYLAVDGGMMSALAHAARGGVDVRVVMPGIWDKQLARMVSSAYMRELIRAGVKVYAYLPGFMHAKSLVADDRAAAVGTANLDYRSLYLHFECGVFLVGAEAVMRVKADFEDTLRDCALLSEGMLARSAAERMAQEALRVVAAGV